MRIALLFFTLLMAGCGTVIPDPVVSSQPSYDGADQNSGIVEVAAGGYYVTPHFRDRYAALAKELGKKFTPEADVDRDVVKSDVLSQGGAPTWFIDREHMVKFIEMNVWHKMGRTP